MPATDPVAKEAYDNIGLVLKFYQDKFGWTSIDDRNMRIVSSVHFGEQFQNAYWDPVRRQMVFGDGSTFLYHFTRSIDVIGHELTVGALPSIPSSATSRWTQGVDSSISTPSPSTRAPLCTKASPEP